MSESLQAALKYQDAILPGVSRTFALTIPQLPGDLRCVVTNAYLLCRAADTIEDEPALSSADKHRFEESFVEVVAGRSDAAALAAEIAPRLSAATLEAERELMRELPQVIAVLRSLRPVQQRAIERCVAVMGRGMHRFQQGAGVHGLATQAEMDSYCYYVAGVVGEMLTDLFAAHDPEIAAQHEAMMRFAVSFGQGLQMTNILKDQWEDRARGACWLPREVFARHGLELSTLQAGHNPVAYAAVQNELIGVAHAHLRNALEYTLLIPARYAGMRRFCLWAIGLAVLTLRNLHETPGFTAGAQIKVSRGAVARTIMVCNMFVRSNNLLRRVFNIAWRKLPLTPLPVDWGHLPDTTRTEPHPAT
ncbi:MAG: phytoene/squalene synthase family protein [Pseudomonadota bacterium]